MGEYIKITNTKIKIPERGKYKVGCLEKKIKNKGDIFVGVDLSKHNISWTIIKGGVLYKTSYCGMPRRKHFAELYRQLLILKNNKEKIKIGIEKQEKESPLFKITQKFIEFFRGEPAIKIFTMPPAKWREELFKEKECKRENIFNLPATKSPALEKAIADMGVEFWKIPRGTRDRKGVGTWKGEKIKLDADLIESYCIACYVKKI